jgi:nucleoside phosphorylase
MLNLNIKSEPIDLSCKTLLHLINDKNYTIFNDYILSDFIHKFSILNKCKEKQDIAIKALMSDKITDKSPFIEYIKGDNPMPTSKHFDVLLLTVVPNEFTSLKAFYKLSDKHDESLSRNGIRFWNLKIQNEPLKKDLNCLAAMISEATNERAAFATGVALCNYTFDLAVLIGIAAGPRGKVKLCDVVCAEQILDYENNKIVVSGEKLRPSNKDITTTLRSSIFHFTSKSYVFNEEYSNNARNSIASNFKPLKYIKELKPSFKFAPILAGNKLLSDKLTLNKLINKYHDKARAAEMEANGFALTCDGYLTPWLVFRGISDYGDSKKNDKYQIPAALSAIYACDLYLRKDYGEI